MLRDLLAQEGVKAGRLHVATLMKRMGVEAPISQAKHLETGAGPQYSPLSAAKAGRHPARAKSHSHACKHALPCSGAMDITYIPPLGECMHSPRGQWMARGFIYLAAVLDWFTRRVLAWGPTRRSAMRACAKTAVGGGDRLPMARGGADGRDHARLGEDGCQAHHHAKRGDPHGSGPGDQLTDMTDDALLEDGAIDRLAEIFCAARSLALPLD
jgi:hypothetical protein